MDYAPSAIVNYRGVCTSMIDKDSDLIEWNNSENFIPGDFIKYRGKTGIVLEQVHQYIKTDIPSAGWINIIIEGPYTVRGVPKFCKRCKHFKYNYSSESSLCLIDKNIHKCEDSCSEWTLRYTDGKIRMRGYLCSYHYKQEWILS